MNATLIRLRSLSQLGPDWDSYGGDPPTADALRQAERFLCDAVENLAADVARRAEPWAVVARGDGGLILERRAPALVLEVHVEPDGRLSYLLDKTVGISLATPNATTHPGPKSKTCSRA